MSYFFSEKMTYCEAMLPIEIAWDVMNQLGEKQIVAFQNNIINYENPFVKSYRRCEQTLAKITMIRTLFTQFSRIINCKLIDTSDVRQVWKQFENNILASNVEGYLYVNHIEEEINQTHAYLSSQKSEIDSLQKSTQKLILELALLATVKSESKFQPFYLGEKQQIEMIEDFENYQPKQNNVFENKCICINRQDLLMLKRSLFRMTRGNCCIEEFQINVNSIYEYFQNSKYRNKIDDSLKNKLVCMIIYQRGERNMMSNKINRFLGCIDCHILKANINKLTKEIATLEKKIEENNNLQELTIQGIQKYLKKLSKKKQGSSVSWINYMDLYTKKQRQIYRVLSSAKMSTNLMQFNIFIPSKQLPLVIQPKINLPPLILNVKETTKQPPSKFDTNEILKIPQQIVNTYGVPSYGQINPSVFYIMSFGFFIGVMFGDIGHMLMSIPLLLYFKANIWFWTVIFFMGYCGLLYNQFFGLNIGLFNSCYDISNDGVNSIATSIKGCVYPIGIDSIWKASTNEMQFTNSLKMKMAVIIGVVHMMFGLMLRVINNLRKGKISELVTLTLPQIVFLACTFLYMDFLIAYKWLTNYKDTKTAPSIISTMIQVFVNMASENSLDLLFWQNERHFEKLIVVIAIICVPIMLFGKPLVVYCQRKKNINNQSSKIQELAQQKDEHSQISEGDYVQEEKLSNDEIQRKSMLFNNVNNNSGSLKHEEQSLKEIIVHQFIETIQFVLGSVSNTASYLRLWALSLAHAQLSAVIFELTILKMLNGGYSSIIGLFLVFPFFYAITFGVLICMDSMECFLHSLRLHWVQFQNKFYGGKGYLFEPFSFRKIKQT